MISATVREVLSVDSDTVTDSYRTFENRKMAEKEVESSLGRGNILNDEYKSELLKTCVSDGCLLSLRKSNIKVAQTIIPRLNTLKAV